MSLLSVRDLTVKFAMRDNTVTALNQISFDLAKGERLGIVGESGAGKSITGFSLMNLLSRPGYIDSGQILFGGQDITQLSEAEMRKIRGNRMAMIFQDPMVTLNPVLTIGQQMVETLRAHRSLSKAEAEQIAILKLREVYIPSPEERLNQYPHELSGGMRQRIIIAMALLLDPELIIADEPTTALDVTIQADIMELLLELCQSNKVGLILITHDLGVVSQMTERTLVMYAGRLIEAGPTREIINDPQHPYTQGLINALPQQTLPGQRLKQIPGNMPSLTAIPTGCPFSPRCEYAVDHCRKILPEIVRYGQVEVACHEVSRLQNTNFEEASA
ncbi:ABC transporter ATP-binding protein [Phaeobacter italicus]|jgi:peptide/nickel transport system ATP-binding protein|uniref:Stage 0 sporulation protein KD n=1 Tax=Phaeobacter italicus TaxID=481446 RepID=A0A0H5CWS1_9RHOB|nr:ABC transporter ATP-binding protein [Phaeobacter italicus]EEB69379.1 oligopeptide/dipeptide ABC transporter, ATP-binding protein [Ruegeria sp. R11]MEC8017209.1 ABC transporter ATP-binding protein [Pseudomonadota bacterium]MBO9443317.1 ABC transporter ATP-binding protein [Phaeobacter italicus]MBY5978187.1 ABC transporter ATP-binding protein [Phaeobacter italicus]MBY6045598.1 ABC transporter ATP-binding protein [Phaeobacter italicus]